MNDKVYNLEERTLNFSKEAISLCRKLSRDLVTMELMKQLIRSATSIGANYREANEAGGKRDFIYRMKVARKEAKETSYWLELIITNNPKLTSELTCLLSETREIRNIFTAIINRVE